MSVLCGVLIFSWRLIGLVPGNHTSGIYFVNDNHEASSLLWTLFSVVSRFAFQQHLGFYVTSQNGEMTFFRLLLSCDRPFISE